MKYRILKIQPSPYASFLFGTSIFMVQTKTEKKWWWSREPAWRDHTNGKWETLEQAKNFVAELEKEFVVWESE